MADIDIVPAIDASGRRVEEIDDNKEKYREAEHVESAGGIDKVKHEILIEDANKAEDFEHEMTTWQAFKIYRAVSQS
jgi:hypothetical protein